MSSRSPTAGKRRPALATLQHGAAAAPPVPRRSSLAKPARFDIPSDSPGQSPAQKKPRRSASKRVSFGGEHIKLFNNEHDVEWGESPPFALEQQRSQDMHLSSPVPAGNAGASPVAPRGRNSPALPPRRCPRLSRQFSEENADVHGDDGDTLTLPLMSEMIQEQSNTPQRFSRSPVFMDEHVAPGVAAPRLSVAGGYGDDTTVVVPIPAPVTCLNTASGDPGVRPRRESMQSIQSDEDITQQIPLMNGLLDADEADDAASDGGLRRSPGHKDHSSPFANAAEVFQDLGDGKCNLGKVASESEALSRASLSAEDTEANDSPHIQLKDDAEQSSGSAVFSHAQSPLSSSAGTSGRVSLGNITINMPYDINALLNLDEPSTPAVTEAKTVVSPANGPSTSTSPRPSSPAVSSPAVAAADPVIPPAIESSTSTSPRPSSPAVNVAETAVPPAIEPSTLTFPRPVLPESRQLFSSEMQGDDTTIHYHDVVSQAYVSVQELPHASKDRSTSPTGNDRSGLSSCKKNREESESAAHTIPSRPIRESQIEPIGAVQQTARDEMTSSSDVESGKNVISDFLEGVNVQFRDFDFKDFQRGASLGVGLESRESDTGENQSTEDAKRAALFKQVYAAARSSVLLKELNNSVKEMQEEIATRKARVAELKAKISRDPPKYFERVLDSEKLKLNELPKIQLEFKRLRKACAMQAKREHVLIRSEREQRIEKQVRHQLAALQIDQGLLRSSTEVLASEAAKVAASVNEHGLQTAIAQVAGSETDSTVTQTLRSEVRSRVAALADLQVSIKQAISKRESLVSEKSALVARNSELKSEVGSLENDANASSVHELKKQIEQRRKEHDLLSRITGVWLLARSDTKLHVRVLNLLDVHFGLQGNDVNLVTCSPSPRSQPADPESPFEDLVAGSISSFNERCLKNIRVIADIQVALQRGVAFLVRVLHVERELAQYRKTREVFFKTADSQGTSAVAGRMIARAEYYSISKHCKFDVLISILATAPAWPSTSTLTGDLQIRVEAVDSIIGACPTEEAVSKEVSSATTAPCVRPIFDALTSIWKLLE